MRNLGKKIVVVGVSAAGKSVFARRLAEKIGMPVVFIDAIMWKPGWEYVGDEETARRLEESSRGEEWIIEGYITKAVRAAVFERANTIVYLDYSPWVVVWRYVTRWWKHRKHHRSELPGSPDKFSWSRLKLAWTKGEEISLNKFLAAVKDQGKIITLRTPAETRKFLSSL